MARVCYNLHPNLGYITVEGMDLWCNSRTPCNQQGPLCKGYGIKLQENTIFLPFKRVIQSMPFNRSTQTFAFNSTIQNALKPSLCYKIKIRDTQHGGMLIFYRWIIFKSNRSSLLYGFGKAKKIKKKKLPSDKVKNLHWSDVVSSVVEYF